MHKRKGMPPDPLDYALMVAIVWWFLVCMFVPQAAHIVRLSALMAGGLMFISAQRYQ